MHKMQKVIETLVSDPFLQDQYWAYLWVNRMKFLAVCIYCMHKSRTNKMYWKKVVDRLLLLHKKVLNIKKRSETCLSTSFSAWFLKKNISPFLFYYMTKLHHSSIWHYVYCNYLLSSLWIHKFFKLFSNTTKRVKVKNWISEEWKEILRWNKK